MNKNELIIPAVALVVAVLLGGFVVWNSGRNGSDDAAAPAMSTTTLSTSLDAPSGPATTRRPLSEGAHYAYGTVPLVLNQVAGFASGLSIRPLAVLEDSRCPEGAECVQAGTVKLHVRATTDTYTRSAATSVVTLELGTPVEIGKNRVELVSVEPAPTPAGDPSPAAYRFAIRVDTAESIAADTRCYVGGCSNQLCSDQSDAVSTCEFRAEYACYRAARCERQASGRCGWTETPELSACLANPPAAE